MSDGMYVAAACIGLALCGWGALLLMARDVDSWDDQGRDLPPPQAPIDLTHRAGRK